MASDPTAALNEIADLLRQRVELARQAHEYMEERQRTSERVVAEMTDKMPNLRAADHPALDMQSVRERIDRSAAQSARALEETREYRERLLAEFERHNASLERILDILAHDHGTGAGRP